MKQEVDPVQGALSSWETLDCFGFPSVSTQGANHGLCRRCATALEQCFVQHRSAKHEAVPEFL